MDGDQKNRFDVAIVGGGPAGSSAAIRLAAAGLSVVLIEQKQFPREKLCGEFISPECLEHFQELGVMTSVAAAGGSRISETVFFLSGGRSVSVPSEWFGDGDTIALGLSRSEMDFRLLERAKKNGVRIFDQQTVTGLRMDGETVVGLKLKTQNKKEMLIDAKIVIDATGRSRSLARHFEKSSPTRSPAKFIAFKTHLANVDIQPENCEIYAYRGGYGGCSRVENGLFNLCFIASAEDTKNYGSDPEAVWRKVVLRNRRAAQTMGNATIQKPWLAVPIERYGRGNLVPAKGLIAVGDAAAFIDPFTGSGILMALESSKIAAAAIIRYFQNGSEFSDLASGYKHDYSAHFDARLRICSILRYAAFAPSMAGIVISTLGISSALRRRLARATRF